MSSKAYKKGYIAVFLQYIPIEVVHMAFGIGVDCEEISRFKDISLEKNFLSKVFTNKELQYCKFKPNPSQHLAARFVGKEAVIKAFNNINKKLFFKEIEILNDKEGIPHVNILKDGVNEDFDIKISLTHSRNNAVAFAVVVSKNEQK